MTPTERRIDRLKTIGVVLGMLVVLVVMVQTFQRRQLKQDALNANPRYTIGGITRTSYVVGPSPYKAVFFVYRVGDSVYTGSGSGTPVNGQERVLVKFAAQQPRLHEAYEQVPIPNSIQEAPPGGWTEPPFSVPDYVRE